MIAKPPASFTSLDSLISVLLALAACTAKTETTTTDTAADAATTTDTAAEQPADTEAEQPTDTNGDVTTITLAMHVSNTQEQEPAVYQAIQAFQQENPDVKIELVEHLTEEHNKQLKLWAQSGELPDIFWCQEGDVLEYGENGYLLPLNDFMLKCDIGADVRYFTFQHTCNLES